MLPQPGAIPWLLIAYAVLLLVAGGLVGWYFGRSAGYDKGVRHGYHRAKERYEPKSFDYQLRGYRSGEAARGQDIRIDWSGREEGVGATGPTLLGTREDIGSERFLQEGREADLGKRPSKPRPPGRASEADLIMELYNNDPATFRQTYQPERFGVTNAAELVRRRDVTPVFDRSEGGSFWLVRSKDGSDCYLVPRAGLVVSNAEFEAGGMAAVFTTRPAYRSGSRYREVRVIRPARVKAIGSHWEISEPGELRLGGEEREA